MQILVEDWLKKQNKALNMIHNDPFVNRALDENDRKKIEDAANKSLECLDSNPDTSFENTK